MITVRQGVLVLCILSCGGCHKGNGPESGVDSASSITQNTETPERNVVIDEGSARATPEENLEVCDPENLSNTEQGEGLNPCRVLEQKVLTPEVLSEDRGPQCRRLASCCPMLREALIHEGRHQGIENAVNTCVISANRTTESDCEMRRTRILERVTYYLLTFPEGCE
jgi:hypothetical protein